MKKDPIDKLFEEKLRDYSEVPDEKVWKAIEASLQKKKNSRKIIPIWWKLGGAAAILALMFYLVDPAGFRTDAERQVTDTEKTEPASNLRDIDPQFETIPPGAPQNPVTATGSDEAADMDAEASGRSAVTGSKPEASAGENAIALRENTAPIKKSNPAGNGQTSNLQPGEAPPQLISSGDDPVSAGDEGTGLAQNNNAQQPPDTQPDDPGKDSRKPGAHAGGLPGQSEEVAENPEKEEAGAGKSLFDEINEKEQEEALAENHSPRWSVGPRVAPVYFNSLGQGSPIHSSFVANSKSGNVNFSYGLSLSYNITPKLSIRSGVHKVDYGYDTNDINFSPTFAATAGQQINNIDYALASRNLVVRNASQAKAEQDALSAEVSASFPSRDGRMVQQFGYVEVPLELNLALIDSKLGLHLIGGLSSLFLIDNTVTLEADGSTTEMGEANNLNPLNFSTNIGLGLQYEVSPRIQLNLEPVFKYQLNTFSDAAGDFNPYSIGVYSGLNFKF